MFTSKTSACALVAALMLPFALSLAGCQTASTDNENGYSAASTDNENTSGRTNTGSIGWTPDQMLSDACTGSGSIKANGGTSLHEDAEVESYPSTNDLYTSDLSGETYAQSAENAFVKVSDNPLSTLSADVDTASYSNLRRIINDGGGDIPVDAVRAEEMINYFDYDYPAPQGKDKFSISSKIGECPWNNSSKLLSVGFQAGKSQSQIAGKNIVFLVDVSGSMDYEDSLPLFKKGFEKSFGQFSSKDKISLVTYASGEKVVLDGIAGNEEDKIKKAVDGLVAEGSTNGEAGLEKAYEIARANYIEGGVNRIVMASDGDLNVGMSSVDEITDYVSKKREEGIYISVLGFGAGNYNDENMEAIADNGNGKYHYIDSVEEMTRVLSRKLIRNTIPFANDVKLELAFDGDEVESYRLIGYENRTMTKEEFDDDTKDAADIGPGDQFTVLYEIVPKQDSVSHIADVTVKYKPIENWKVSDKSESQKGSISSGDGSQITDEDFAFQSAVAMAAQVWGQSEHAKDASLSEVRVLLKNAKINGDADREGFSKLVDKSER